MFIILLFSRYDTKLTHWTFLAAEDPDEATELVEELLNPPMEY